MSDLAIPPTMGELLAAVMRGATQDLCVGAKATVTKFDRDRKTVDVKIDAKRQLRDENGNLVEEDFPELLAVPVNYPEGGGHAILWELEVGDKVTLSFMHDSISQWKATGETSIPGDERKHDLGNAIATPGGYPFGKGSTEFAPGKLVISGGGVFLGAAAAAQPMVLGEIQKQWLATHTHLTGTGPSGPPVEVAALDATLSTKHKLDQ